MRPTLLALLIFMQFPLAAARTRPVHAPPVIVPAAIVTAAHQAAKAALNAGVPAVQIAVSHGGQIIYSEAFGVTDTKSAMPAGFGLVVQKILGRPAVWHNGATYGFWTFLVYFSGEDIAIAVNVNTYPAPATGDPEVIALAVAKAALNTQ